MSSISIPSPHRPNHIYADNTFYFVTASTLHHQPLLKPGNHKLHLQERLLSLASQYELSVSAWVILNNHYHILCHLKDGKKLARFIKHLHGQTSTNFNRWDNQLGRQCWYNYWDWCIRNESDYWRHFNYIHYNPIKHGYVQQLRDWPFSSLEKYFEIEGREWLNDCWRSYPIKEFAIMNDDF
jgi:putative transposase